MQRKKVGILTFYFYNFNMGGMLQAYALQKTLEKLGYDAEQICYDYKGNYTVTKSLASKIKNSKIGKYIVSVRRWIRAGKLIGRSVHFKQFMERIPHSKEIVHSDRELLGKYDKVIVGSDQIWNSDLSQSVLECFLLKHLDEEKSKYTYAASFGKGTLLKDNIALYKETLSHFSKISVREPGIIPQLKELFPEKEVRMDLDPTLLVSAEEWKQLIKKDYKKEKYLLCYFLGDDPTYYTETQKLAKRCGLKMVTFPYIRSGCVNDQEELFGEYKDYTSGPIEFLSAIQNAQIVVTDSFHATVFSTQFHKKFFVMARKDGALSNTNTRMLDFLELFGLTSQYIQVSELLNVDVNAEVDFSCFDHKIKGLRASSIAYLKEI